MDRSLRLAKVPEQILTALSSAGIYTVRDFYSVGELRLAQLLPWLAVPEVGKLVVDVSSQVAPRAMTALTLYDGWVNLNRSVPTGLKKLDVALGRGVPSDSVTELVGRAGVGKTQTCFTLAVQACLSVILDDDRKSPQSLKNLELGSACYLDTERKFSAERVLQIAEARVKSMDPLLDDASVKQVASSIVERIRVFTLTSCSDVLSVLTDTRALQAFIIENRAKIIVVDSIAAVARQDFAGGAGLIKRQQWLNKIASQLKYLAESFHLPVVVTNQVTTSSSLNYLAPGLSLGLGSSGNLFGTDTQDDVIDSKSSDVAFREHMVAGLAGGGVHAPSLRPALGNTWAHGINTRLFLDVDAAAGSNHGTQRCIHITKSPSCPYLAVPFKIDALGISG